MRKKRRIACAASARREGVVEDYLKTKEEYMTEVQRAQTSSWKAFCERQDGETLWDGIYRVIGRTSSTKIDEPLVQNGKALEGDESVRLLAHTFYPEDTTSEDSDDHRALRARADTVNDGEHEESCDPPFTEEELRRSAASFNPKKAPGPDGLTADICRAAIALRPEMFLSLFNKCLALSHFPVAWKTAAVVILRKSGKTDYTNPESYRPIGLLPVLGKILEKMLIKRIRWHILPTMSEKQYGFTPQKSTEDSLYAMMRVIKSGLKDKKLITVVSLDIEGAFDAAWWPAIKCRLADSGCPVNLRRLVDSYLKQREVRVRYAGAEYSRSTTKGCVQGSIGGPTFWNILLDPLLKEIEGMGEHAQAFADDVVLIISGDSGAEVQRRANVVLARVQGWGVENKLRFAPHKTQAMTITNRLKFDTPALTMGGVPIVPSKSIKILGLTIDDRLTFNEHTTNICNKAANLYKQLARAAKVEWGLNPEVVRTIYVAVIEPVIMYAASAWAPAAMKIGTRKKLDAVQRGFVRKIIKAYRTVSLNAALTLAGLLPLDLRIQEAASLYEVKRGHSWRVIGDREVETPVAYAEAPHPASLQAIEFSKLGDGAERDQPTSNSVNIFTDGSKIEGKVGAALSLWRNGAESRSKKLKLESFCSVYQAELLALNLATDWVLKGVDAEININSNSRAALETIVDSGSLHPLAVSSRKNIRAARAENKKVKLFWVKAHAGVEGNERADDLAKQAALGLKRKPDYDHCPVSFVKRQIRLDALDEWNRRYKEGETASTTKVFFPDAVEAYKIIRKLKLDSLLTQILTGHGGFSEYLNRFKCKGSPSCICDPQKEESIIHVLTECPQSMSERFQLESKIGMDINRATIKDIMRSTEHRTDFIEYCRVQAKRVIKRNG